MQNLSDAVYNLIDHYRRYGSVTDSLMDDLDLAYYGSCHNSVMTDIQNGEPTFAHHELLKQFDALPPLDELNEAGQILTSAQEYGKD